MYFGNSEVWGLRREAAEDWRSSVAVWEGGVSSGVVESDLAVFERPGETSETGGRSMQLDDGKPTKGVFFKNNTVFRQF